MARIINVPRGERGVRIVIGLAALVGGVVWALSGGVWGGALVALSGVGLFVTGFVGWCPLCAMVGRTLPKSDKKIFVEKL